MVDWRAVLTGFAAGLVISIIGLGLPIIGQIGGGLIGGFIAGYLSGGGLASGAWHGLLAGVLGGLVLTVVISLGTALFGFAINEGVSGLLGGVGLFFIGVFLAALLAVDSAIAGAIGGLLNA
jgi:hypothetical protein